MPVTGRSPVHTSMGLAAWTRPPNAQHWGCCMQADAALWPHKLSLTCTYVCVSHGEQHSTSKEKHSNVLVLMANKRLFHYKHVYCCGVRQCNVANLHRCSLKINYFKVLLMGGIYCGFRPLSGSPQVMKSCMLQLRKSLQAEITTNTCYYFFSERFYLAEVVLLQYTACRI